MVLWGTAGRKLVKLICMAAIILFVVLRSSVIGDTVEDKRHLELCKKNLRAIGEAIKAYRVDHN